MAEKFSVDLKVKKHKKDEKAGKEPVYTVELETAEKHDPKMKMTISSNTDTRQDFPLEETFTFSCSTQQTKLDD